MDETLRASASPREKRLIPIPIPRPNLRASAPPREPNNDRHYVGTDHYPPKAACAAASLAIGTRNGEHET